MSFCKHKKSLVPAVNITLAGLTVWAFSVLALLLCLSSARVLANPYDISLRGLGRPSPGAVCNVTCNDPAAERYRLLANDLAAAMLPKPLAPAETLGMNGFEFGLASTFANINASKDYWQGQPGIPIFEAPLRGRKIPETLWIPTLTFRKGLPLSTELGVTGAYLGSSEILMLGGDLKIAIHEAFFRWFPTISARANISRLFGASDLDILAGSAGGIMSLPVGINGVFQLTPYFAYEKLWFHVNSQVIDATPHDVTHPSTDQRGGLNGSLYNFPTINWKQNSHYRRTFGARIIVSFVEIIAEWNVTKLKTQDDLSTYTLKVGFDT